MLQGGDGADLLRGGGGDDTLANRFTPSFQEDGAADRLFGEAGNDTLIIGNLDEGYGGSGNDLFIVVGSSPVVIDGGTGTDTVRVGAGISIGNATLAALERLELSASGSFGGTNLTATQLGQFGTLAPLAGQSAGFAKLVGGGNATFTPHASLDTLTITGSAETERLTMASGSDTKLHYSGGSGNGTVIARDGDDILEGGDGSDVLRGGGGDDTLANRFTPSFQEDGAADRLFGEAGNDTLIIGNLDEGYGGSGNDTIRAVGAAKLFGGDGNDLLIGSFGNDVISGAGGTDTASYEATNSAVVVSLAIAAAQNTGGGGIDTLSGIENLVGGGGSDTLTGNGGANIIQGRSGNDIINGAGGSDTASYEGTSPVTVDLRIAGQQNTGGAGLDTLTSIENLIGSTGNDTLIGKGGANVLEGGAGDDVINGMGGADTASYASAASRVVVGLAAGGAQQTQGAGIDTLTSIENLRGSGFDDVLTGNGGANRLDGAEGNDILKGAGGDDTLIGGAGTDTATYAGSSSGVAVNLGLAGPQDTGGAGIDTLATVENLVGSSFGDVLTGNGSANVLTGGAGNDRLLGGAGNDTLNGQAGNDVLIGGAGIDTASYAGTSGAVTVDLTRTAQQNTGGAGLDRLNGIENMIGGNGNDHLTGNALANRLTGGNGNDVLAGGAGDDTLVGGNGLDDFLFTPGGGRDVITDFAESEDQLGISGFGTGFDSFAEVRAASVQVGDNVEITLPDPGAATSTVIVMEDYLRALLSPGDFAFISA